MPCRKVPLVTGHFYHVFNQGVDRRVVFGAKREYRRFLATLRFYLYEQSFIKMAHYLVRGKDQASILQRIRESPKRANVLAFCLMPNHFHLVVEQLVDKGISRLLADVQNSYTRYFNSKHERRGSLFLTPFKAVRVETDEQLMHLARYVHLNPFSSGVVDRLEKLVEYPYSSLVEYLDYGVDSGIVSKEKLEGYFSSQEDHQRFVFDRADYQRRLELVKHLVVEDELV